MAAILAAGGYRRLCVVFSVIYGAKPVNYRKIDTLSLDTPGKSSSYSGCCSSGCTQELVFGYSRAVRVGNLIEVAGTTAVDENGQYIGVIKPTSTMVKVSALIDPALLVEIGTTALVELWNEETGK